MRQYLSERYKENHITAIEIDRAINRLTADAGVSTYEQNAITLRFIIEGFSIQREDTQLPDLTLLLAEYGYPPISHENAYKEIFEQTENFKKYNG